MLHPALRISKARLASSRANFIHKHALSCGPELPRNTMPAVAQSADPPRGSRPKTKPQTPPRRSPACCPSSTDRHPAGCRSRVADPAGLPTFLPPVGSEMLVHPSLRPLHRPADPPCRPASACLSSAPPRPAAAPHSSPIPSCPRPPPALPNTLRPGSPPGPASTEPSPAAARVAPFSGRSQLHRFVAWPAPRMPDGV